MLELLVTQFYLPAGVFIFFSFVLGMIFGSFLDVCISRFHTGKSIGGSSACMSCGKSLAWYELIPFISYTMQLGRCRGCGSRIPVRLLLMEVVTGCLFVAVLCTAAGVLEAVWLAVVMLVLLFITVYDYWHFIIPDELTLLSLALTGGWLGYGWYVGQFSLMQIGITIAASLAGAGFFFLLWFVSGGRWLGFGDVKLAVPLGLWVGPAGIFSYIVLSFWIGALVSVSMLYWQKYQRGKHSLHLSQETLTMKSAVPFAPFMIAGAALVYFFNLNVLTFFSITI